MVTSIAATRCVAIERRLKCAITLPLSSSRLRKGKCSMVVTMLFRASRASRKKKMLSRCDMEKAAQETMVSKSREQRPIRELMSRPQRENSHDKKTKATAIENVVMACLLPSTHQALVLSEGGITLSHLKCWECSCPRPRRFGALATLACNPGNPQNSRNS